MIKLYNNGVNKNCPKTGAFWFPLSALQPHTPELAPQGD